MFKRFETKYSFSCSNNNFRIKCNNLFGIIYFNKKLNYIWNLNWLTINKNIHEYIRNNSNIDWIKQKIFSLWLIKITKKWFSYFHMDKLNI
jgi:hypothetical protein